MKRRLLSAQFLFPAVIVVAFAVVMVLSAFHQPGVILIKYPDDEQSYATVCFVEESEADLFEPTDTFARVKIVGYDGRYRTAHPWEPSYLSLLCDIYTMEIQEVYYEPEGYEVLHPGKRVKLTVLAENSYKRELEEESELLIILSDARGSTLPGSVKGYDAERYWQDLFEKLGYSPANRLWQYIPVERDGTVKSAYVPLFLRGIEETKTYTPDQVAERIMQWGEQEWAK